MSSMLGCVAAVIAIVSPSHPRPAVIQRTSISEIDPEFCVRASAMLASRCTGDRFRQREAAREFELTPAAFLAQYFTLIFRTVVSAACSTTSGSWTTLVFLIQLTTD